MPGVPLNRRVGCVRMDDRPLCLRAELLRIVAQSTAIGARWSSTLQRVGQHDLRPEAAASGAAWDDVHMRINLPLLAAVAVVAAGCSSGPTESNSLRDLEERVLRLEEAAASAEAESPLADSARDLHEARGDSDATPVDQGDGQSVVENEQARDALVVLDDEADLLIEAEEALGAFPQFRPGGGIEVAGEASDVRILLRGDGLAAQPAVVAFLEALGFAPQGLLDGAAGSAASVTGSYQAEWSENEGITNVRVSRI